MARMKLRADLSFYELTFVAASRLREATDEIPEQPGVYLWFVKGGEKILELTHHYETDALCPLSYEGREHLYTGAAWDLRSRINQHLRNEDPGQSSPRKSLLAVERVFGAVTEASDSNIDIEGEGGLTDWIHENVVFGYRQHSNPYYYEIQLLQELRSPFNIAHRRRHRYSKYLMAWRAFAFPSDWMADVPFGRFEASAGSIAAQRKRRSAPVLVK